MKETAKALYSFFSSFGIPAYAENTIPDDAQAPYITYQPVNPRWDEQTSLAATVWYKGTSLNDLFGKVDEIERKVGEGLRIPTENGGCIWIYKEDPWAQPQDVEQDDVKAEYLLFGIHALC